VVAALRMCDMAATYAWTAFSSPVVAAAKGPGFLVKIPLVAKAEEPPADLEAATRPVTRVVPAPGVRKLRAAWVELAATLLEAPKMERRETRERWVTAAVAGTAATIPLRAALTTEAEVAAAAAATTAAAVAAEVVLRSLACTERQAVGEEGDRHTSSRVQKSFRVGKVGRAPLAMGWWFLVGRETFTLHTLFVRRDCGRGNPCSLRRSAAADRRSRRDDAEPYDSDAARSRSHHCKLQLTSSCAR
jgi:hypothetical protein